MKTFAEREKALDEFDHETYMIVLGMCATVWGLFGFLLGVLLV